MNLIKRTVLMKTALFSALLGINAALTPLAEARSNVSLETLAGQWEHVSVSTGLNKEKATIHELLSAFHRHWPTGVFGKLLQDEKGVMDIKNGYAEVQFHNPETDNVEVGVATIWRRTNGHTLMGITIDRNISDFGTSQIEIFYDYNPMRAVRYRSRTRRFVRWWNCRVREKISRLPNSTQGSASVSGIPAPLTA